MRKITREAISSLIAHRAFKKSNTEVRIEPNGDAELFLHNNHIATYTADDSLFITSAGWQTNTTKERLNALPNVHIYQRNFDWYLNDEYWSGEWVKVF